MSENGKMIIIATHGPEDPERASIPFVMALAALASDMEVVLGFQGNGVMLMRNGCAEHVFASGFPSLAELMENYREMGGEYLVCGPCVQSRQIDPAADFIEGATVVSGATFIAHISESVNALVY